MGKSHHKKKNQCNLEIKTIEDLERVLKLAMTIEFATVPLYLTAAYSIKNPASRSFQLIMSVVIEEMLHIAQAGNLLVSIGGKPALAPPPEYPTPIPCHCSKEPILELQKASIDLMENVFMAIETPQDSIKLDEDCFKTIGQLYESISKGFKHLEKEIPFETEGQFESIYYGSGGKLVIVKNLESADEAINEIVAQGEGTIIGSKNHKLQESKWEHYGPNGEWALSHYYRFKLMADSSLAHYCPIGDVYPMKTNIKLKDLNGLSYKILLLFNQCYSLMLLLLDQGLYKNKKSELFFKVNMVIMNTVLPKIAVELLKIPISESENAGPSFEFQNEIQQLTHDDALKQILKSLDSIIMEIDGSKFNEGYSQSYFTENSQNILMNMKALKETIKGLKDNIQESILV